MKKMFDIKKISIALFTFLCMFLVTNNVKAAGKYVCNYSIGAGHLSDDNNFYKNYEIRVTYDNGNYSIGTYKDGKYYDSSETKNSRKDGFFIGDLTNFKGGAPLSVSASTLTNFKSFDFEKSKGCPNKIYFTSVTDPENFGGYHLTYSIINNTPYDIDKGECGGSGMYGTCGAVVLNASTSITPSQGGGGQSGGTPTGIYKTCSYADLGNYAGYQDTSKDFTIKFDENNVYITVDDTKAITWELYANFTAQELKGDCPNVLFMAEPGAGATAVNLKKTSGITAYRYGLIVELNESTVQDPQNNICSGKTMKFVKVAYNLIRFLLPILVIVFSIIDFVGVVLSGETEKMEKAKKRFAIRLIVAAAILFVPAIIELLLKLAGIIDSGAGLVEFTCNLFD